MCAGMVWPQVRAGISPTHDSWLQQSSKWLLQTLGTVIMYQQHQGVQRCERGAKQYELCLARCIAGLIC